MQSFQQQSSGRNKTIGLVIVAIALVAIIAFTFGQEAEPFPLHGLIHRGKNPRDGNGTEQFETDADGAVLLRQRNFRFGTVRLTKPGVYKLAENIVFEPNRGVGKNGPFAFLPDFRKRSQRRKYSGGPYSLGFFTAIAMEADGITLDLNGKSIKQSKAFYLQQRFYAHITLANIPFIVGVGPSDWGSTMKVATNCVVKNGVLGLSSHHGIQGNGATGCTLKNLKIKNFEVAGIAINDAHQVKIKNVKIVKSAQALPVAGTYGNSRFMLMFMRRIPIAVRRAKKITFADGRTYSLQQLLKRLERGMNLMFDKFVLNDNSVVNKPYYSSEWENDAGLPDGSAVYGIVINGKGPAANGIGASASTSESVSMQNVIVSGLKSSMQEVVAIQDAVGGIVSGSTGNQLNIERVSDGRPLNLAKYKGTLLADAIIAMNKLAPSAVKATMRTLNIPSFIEDWALKGKPLKSSDYKLVCNGDSQFHVGKGLFGIRIDGTTNFALKNVIVKNLENCGGYGQGVCGAYSQSIAAAAETIGYGGTPAYGISITKSTGQLKNVVVSDVSSVRGLAYGIVVWSDATVTFKGRTRINKIFALGQGNLPPNPKGASLPNLKAVACGIDIRTSSVQLKGQRRNVRSRCLAGLDLCKKRGTKFGLGDTTCPARGMSLDQSLEEFFEEF